MTARVLVVDDIDANVRMLEARLLAEYFDVLTATNGMSAIEICKTQSVDIVLLDIMMPQMDGFEVCQLLKADPRTAHIPVVMVTALDQPSDRVRGLKAGADDFLTKPVNDVQLVARVKSLVRLKTMIDELRLRSEAAMAVGADEALTSDTDLHKSAQILLVEARLSSRERTERAIKSLGQVTSISDPHAAFASAATGAYDLMIVSHLDGDQDPLRLCAHMRRDERTRHLPILLCTEAGDDRTVVQALELGVNDYITRPLDPNELIARSLTQIKRKRYNARLREGLKTVVDMAIVDPLTGLNNRRYLDSHLKIVFDRARERGRPMSLCMIDVDHFKSINDTHGHLVGDQVLQEFANCLRKAVRGADLICRYGGEEFVLVMPDTDMAVAANVSERLRLTIAEKRFDVAGVETPLTVTASFGLASMSDALSDAHDLLRQADRALYTAKTDGRNRVVLDAA